MVLTETPLAALPAYRSTAVQALRAGKLEQHTDSVAEETPVALAFNGISHAVMMASPLDLEDLGYGFALTEGIVDSATQIHDVE